MDDTRGTFIVTWNPEVWENDHDQGVEDFAGDPIPSEWSVGVRKDGIEPGDWVFFLRQGKDRRGILARGQFTSDVFQEEHWNGVPGDVANSATMDLLEYVKVESRLPTEYLLDTVPGVFWNNIAASGIQVRGEDAELLHAEWEAHFNSRLDPDVVANAEDILPEQEYIEGLAVRVPVNRYERSHAARQDCLEYHGYSCSVCGFDFGVAFGPIGEGFMHVHHLEELSLGDGPVTVNPITDMRPLCPNCHAMAHRRRPAFSIEELQQMLRSAGGLSSFE